MNLREPTCKGGENRKGKKGMEGRCLSSICLFLCQAEWLTPDNLHLAFGYLCSSVVKRTLKNSTQEFGHVRRPLVSRLVNFLHSLSLCFSVEHYS